MGSIYYPPDYTGTLEDDLVVYNAVSTDDSNGLNDTFKIKNIENYPDTILSEKNQGIYI